MGWLPFTSQCRQALKPSLPHGARRWALWRACESVAGMLRHATQEEVRGEEIYRLLATRLGFAPERTPREEQQPSIDQIVEAMGLLVTVRFHLLAALHRWQIARKQAKTLGKRFPVTRPFTRAEALELIRRAW